MGLVHWSPCCILAPKMAILYPESSGSLASGWLPRENSKKFKFFLLASAKRLALFYHRNHAVKKFQFPSVSPGDQLLAKEPEDSGYETAN